MKTEKQVEKMLATIDERVVDIFRRKAEEYLEKYNKAAYEEDRHFYTQRLGALMDIADEFGYDWKTDIEDSIKRIRPHTVSIVRHKVTYKVTEGL